MHPGEVPHDERARRCTGQIVDQEHRRHGHDANSSKHPPHAVGVGFEAVRARFLQDRSKEDVMQKGRIAVAGATGRAGRHVVDVLQSRGLEVIAMSRSTGVDVITGKGVAEALAGVECVIDVTGAPSEEQAAATEFFTAAARNLNEAGRRAGVRRMVVLSIIGIDRFTHGYNAAKVAHERAVLSGSIPVRILRAAQFHELVPLFVEWGRKGQVSYLPKMRTQLVAARTAAEALVDLATTDEIRLARIKPSTPRPRRSPVRNGPKT